MSAGQNFSWCLNGIGGKASLSKVNDKHSCLGFPSIYFALRHVLWKVKGVGKYELLISSRRCSFWSCRALVLTIKGLAKTCWKHESKQAKKVGGIVAVRRETKTKEPIFKMPCNDYTSFVTSTNHSHWACSFEFAPIYFDTNGATLCWSLISYTHYTH